MALEVLFIQLNDLAPEQPVPVQQVDQQIGRSALGKGVAMYARSWGSRQFYPNVVRQKDFIGSRIGLFILVGKGCPHLIRCPVHLEHGHQQQISVV